MVPRNSTASYAVNFLEIYALTCIAESINWAPHSQIVKFLALALVYAYSFTWSAFLVKLLLLTDGLKLVAQAELSN